MWYVPTVCPKFSRILCSTDVGLWLGVTSEQTSVKSQRLEQNRLPVPRVALEGATETSEKDISPVSYGENKKQYTQKSV